MSPSGADVVDHEDSNISSPLSEVDDKDGNDDDINMHLNGEDEHDSSMTADGQVDTNQDGLDSDSDLSDARSVAHSDANDTEAETERLYDTPQHQRQRDVVVDQYNDGQVFEHTPSKLRRTAVAHGGHDRADDESILEDAASEVSDGSVAPESPSKVATTKDTSVDDDHQHDSQDRKRKRSLATDNSESEQPLRKRTGSVVAAEVETDQELATKEETLAVPKELGGNLPVADGEETSPVDQYASAEEIPIERETRATKKLTRNGSKRKGSGDVDEATPAEAQEEGHENEVEDEQEQKRETIEVEAEEEAEAEADAAAKSAEEAERKQAAFRDWSRIEEMFGVFRDRLYKDRLQRLEEEEQSLLADEPTHREYLNMKQCLDDRLNRKLRGIDKEKEYRMRATERRFVSIRSQIWSQFSQAIREKRESVLAALDREWYDVQTARRHAHSIGDCGLVFPKDPAQRVKNAVAYNTEVSTLAGIAKYEGFPAGPEINGASASELNDDLSAIEGGTGRHVWAGSSASTSQLRNSYRGRSHLTATITGTVKPTFRIAGADSDGTKAHEPDEADGIAESHPRVKNGRRMSAMDGDSDWLYRIILP
ncbi:hypothetical protein ACO1O0_001206 [Amphichorda felina]